jgi:molybdopterin synthase catalytic subunit
VSAWLGRYDAGVQPPSTGDTWCGLGADPLPIGVVYDWCVRPDCGAVVLFSGTVRDHADDHAGQRRDGVEHLTYEAYEEQVVPTFDTIVAEAREQWPSIGRVVLLHRVGRLGLGESSVVVAVSAPHRPEAFEAARFGIDALKRSAPIWKQESWEGGQGWGLGAHHIEPVRTNPLDVV